MPKPPASHPLLAGILALGLGPACAATGADEHSLEELLDSPLSTPSPNVESVTAAKYSQRGRDTPAITRIVTDEDIRTYGFRTLAEALRSLPGVYVTNDRNYSYLGVRGFGRPSDYNSRILFLIDGERVNENIYDAAYIGQEFPLDIDLVKRVEYAPGPGSAIYGNNAFFGVVNVITKRGQDFDGAELSGQYGAFDTYKGRGTYGKRFENGAEMLLSATGFDRQGPDSLYYPAFDTPGQDGGKSKGLDYERNHSAFAKLNWGGLHVEAGYVDRTKGIPTASYGQVFNDKASLTDDARTFVSLAYEQALAQDWQVYGRLGYHRYDYLGDYPLPPAGTVYKASALGEWWDGELRLLNTAFEGHRLLFGAEVQDNLQQGQKDYDATATYFDYPFHSVRWGIYLQDEISLLDTLALTVGARYDDNPLGGSSANPRVGLVWKPLDTTTLKFLYGTAFRAPNVFERNYQGSTYLPNFQLKPERIESLEWAVEHYATPATRLAASLYYNRIDDLIDQTPVSAAEVQFDNIARAHSLGGELDAEHRFANGASLRLSYAAQCTEDDSHRTLTNSPRHMAKLHLAAPLWDERWRGGLEAMYLSRRLTKGGDTGGYALVNFTVSGEPLKNLRASAGVYNLLNQHYADPVGEDFRQDSIPQDGVGFRLKLDLRF
jgi:outer membrane receptor protein involved in Fe transport